jgi:hypothetical protein
MDCLHLVTLRRLLSAMNLKSCQSTKVDVQSRKEMVRAADKSHSCDDFSWLSPLALAAA